MIKNHEIKFRNNQFIVAQTGKVLHLKPNETFYIQGDDINFLEKDFLDQIRKPLDSKEKLERLQQFHKKDHLELLAAANTEFYFHFGLGRNTIEEEKSGSHFAFKAKILEDLYMFSKNQKTWRMCTCVSEANEIVEGKLDFDFENVEANSLSELFANVISTYFNRKRSTACNAFTDFYFADYSERVSKHWFENNHRSNLDKKRDLITFNIKAKEIKKQLEK
jgi:hypothetical protein